MHTTKAVPDVVAALDQLQAAAPNIESISLVVSWFGTDLRGRITGSPAAGYAGTMDETAAAAT